MIVGVETSTLGNKSSGTNRYLNCLLEQMENCSVPIIKFAPEYKSHSNSFAKKLKKHWYRNFTLTQEIKNSAADCVIFPDYYSPYRVNKNSAIIIHDLSFISHPHFYPRSFTVYYKYLIKRSLEQSPLIVTVSEHSKKNIQNYLNIKEKDILIVQGYSNLQKVNYSRRSERPDERPYLLYVGHIEPRKNLNNLIEGFLIWKQRHKNVFKLKIVGELWIKSASTIELLKRYGSHGDIELTGYISDEELSKTYSNASGFVHTSYEEGFGFPVLEAMNYGLPVLCSKGIATEEISSPFSVTIEPGNLSSIVEGFENLSELIYSLGRIKYDIKYSPELTLNQLNILLDKLEHRGKRAVMNNFKAAVTLNEAINKTFIYSGLFNGGINLEKLHEQLFDLKIQKEELEKEVDKLLLAGYLVFDKSMLFLNDRQKGYYNRSVIKMKEDKIRRLVKLLKNLPLISAITFSGGTANYGLFDHNDIDLFIISKPYSVYIVYFLIHIYSLFAGVRKELCANLLLDETRLKIKFSSDLYTAHQIISLKAFRNNGILNRFFEENKWVTEFFPNFPIPKTEIINRHGFYFILKPLNLLILLFYKKLYAEKLRKNKGNKSLILTEKCLKLHTNDHKDKILMEFEKALDIFHKNSRNKAHQFQDPVLESPET